MAKKIRKCRRRHDITGNNVAYWRKPNTDEYWPRCRACFDTHQRVTEFPVDKPRFQKIADWKYNNYMR